MPTRDPANAIGRVLAPRIRGIRIPAVFIAAFAIVLVQIAVIGIGGVNGIGGLIALVGVQTLVFGLVGAAAMTYLLPRPFRRSLETILWLRDAERARRPRGSDVPETAEQARTWLAGHADVGPSTTAVDALTLTREFARARTLARSLPGDDPWMTFERESRLAWLDLLETGSADLRRVRKAADNVSPERRPEARTSIALAEAHARAWADNGGEAWQAPLVAARDALGPSARGTLLRGYIRRQFIVFVASGLLIALLLNAVPYLLRG